MKELMKPEAAKKMPSTVLVALSGGVDSSVAAALLKDEGWDVSGIHFLLPSSEDKKQERVDSVKRVAEHLSIPLVFADMGAVFSRKIIDPFIEDYLQGLTPSPCVKCNEIIKFDCLLQYAKKDGIEYISTGHYALLEGKDDSSVQLLRGNTASKDQSYFLHRLSQAHLSRTIFPLACMTKEDTRREAQERRLPTKSTPESQEICFIPDNDYRRFVRSRKGGGLFESGDIVDAAGRKLGEHPGIYCYTIGQRHGLGIASSRPYYVLRIIPEENLIVAGRKEELYSTTVETSTFHWITDPPAGDSVNVTAQIRYRHKAAPGVLRIESPGRAILEFDEPQWAITPGQAVVCYDGDRVLGGGWIDKVQA